MLSPRELSQRLNLTLQLTISRIAVSSPDAAGIRDLRNGVGKDPRLCHTNTPGCSKASPPGPLPPPMARILGRMWTLSRRRSLGWNRPGRSWWDRRKVSPSS
jgi:hypothetical protein